MALTARERLYLENVLNQIVHEYAAEDILALIQDVVRYTPELLACAQQVCAYAGVIRTRLEESARAFPDAD